MLGVVGDIFGRKAEPLSRRAGVDSVAFGDGSKPCTLVNIKIAGKWMFIPLKMVFIGIDPYPFHDFDGIYSGI